MKTINVNMELDIKRNPEYKNLQVTYKKTLQNIKSSIYNIFASGKIFERNYSIRHDGECTQNENEYINAIAEIDYKQYEQMYNELLKLKSENIALKKAIKESGIQIEITDMKYYNNEKIVI